ncbi:MAG: DUF3696 domain-containing protein [Magnetococcus sp. THC-1_WYH]
MLTSLHLKNFKAWGDSTPMELKPVTMVLGTNSSGKSSLIQSLLLLKQTVQSPDRTIHLNLGGDEANDLFNFGAFSSILKDGAKVRKFEMEFSFNRQEENSRVSEGSWRGLFGLDSKKAVVAQEIVLASGTRSFILKRNQRDAYSIYVDNRRSLLDKGRDYAPERSIAFSAKAIAKLEPEDGALVEDISLAIRRELENIVYLGPLRRKPERDYVWNRSRPGEVGSDGHRSIDVLLANALEKGDGRATIIDGISKWLAEMQVADKLYVRQISRSSRYEVIVQRNEVAANLRDVGIGISQVLPVLTVAYFAQEGSTVILEEPEIHLHPMAQSVLAELFVEVSKKRNIQFLVETHSEHLFRRIQTLLAKKKITTKTCSLYFVERNGKNASLRPLVVDEFGTVKNWPENFFGDSVGEMRKQAMERAKRMKRSVQA